MKILMRKSIILIITLSFSLLSFSQHKEIRELTPGILNGIKTEIGNKAIKYKATLLKTEMTPAQREFSVDTFKIEQIVLKRMDIDYSTAGMNETINDLTASYDILLNKYYQKLLKSFNLEDKKVLVAAQRAWMSFRDSEATLIWTMTKDEYSGGGTIQSNIATISYSHMVKQRAIEMFNYYDGNIMHN